METIEDKLFDAKTCTSKYVRAINDTMNVINGKWKLPIIAAMLQGQKRFNEILRSIPNLTPRMLSKELRDLEVNGVVVRRVHNTLPVVVEYEPTPSAVRLSEVLDKMIEWGLYHRELIIGAAQEVN